MRYRGACGDLRSAGYRPTVHAPNLSGQCRIEGFLVLDYQHRYVEARTRLAEWNRAGKLQYQYDIADGLENTPNAFLQMLTSKNLGKQLVRVGPEA